MVAGEAEDEKDMFDFFNQVIAAESRGIMSMFDTSVMVSRYWGQDSLATDTSLPTIAKTMKHISAWMHPDHFVISYEQIEGSP